MKFEQLLKIYWTRGFYFNGKLNKTDFSLQTMFDRLPGLSYKIKSCFIRRFELNHHFKSFNRKEIMFTNISSNQKKILNLYFLSITNIRKNMNELVRLNVIRLYLIKSFRGRAQLLGKPSRGQRTWSNAWNAYKCNRIVKLFVSEIVRARKLKQKPQKINYKVVKRKFKKQVFKIKPLQTEKKKNLWF